MRNSSLFVSIINPLLAMDDTTLKTYVTDFYDKKELKDVVDIRTLQRGAMLAKSRQVLQRHYSETDKEKRELDSEDAGELRSMTKALKVLLFTCAIGAVVQ